MALPPCMMVLRRDCRRTVALSTLALLTLPFASSAAQKRAFDVKEASIADIQRAIRTRAVTCHDLVRRYLARIDAYDKKGPAINALVVINADALKTADSLDARFRREGLTGPLHCVPMIVKDNFETRDLPTTAGSLAFQGFVSDKDA